MTAPARTLLRRTDRLVAQSVLVAILLAWLVLGGFDAVTAFGSELDEVGEGGYGVLSALLYVAYTLPRRLYELFPSAAVIGCVMGLGGLAATSELTALRALGLSRLRIALSAMLAVGLLTVLMLVSAETVGPWGEQRAQALVVSAKSSDLVVARWSGLWAREGEVFLNARTGALRGAGEDAYVELSDVRLYEFEPQGRLQSISRAARAEHRAGAWTLFDVRRTRFEGRSARVETASREAWASNLSPELLSLGVMRPRYLSTADLSNGIDYMRRNQLDSGEFETAYWARLFYPVNALLLCLAVTPLAFGSLRSGGFGKRLFLGIAFGLGFFMLQRLAVNLSVVYGIDLRLGYAIPPLLLAAYAAWTFRRA